MQHPPRRLRAAIVALAAIVLPAALLAQGTGTVEGTVTDAASQRPLPNVQVSIQGTGATVGALTNAQGQFRIPNVATGQQNVRARLIGYAQATTAVTVPAGGIGRVTITLRQSAIELSAVVTTGTGGSQVEARKLGNTVASVEMPINAPIPSFSDALQGREPGLMMLPSSGLTGEGARIRIRGNGSLSQNNEPIVYLDGVRIDNGGGFGGFVGTGGGGRPSRLDDINPASIEKVEVLKGAAAATLYGTEASAGVLLITTKKGAVSNTKWSLDVEQAAKTYPRSRIESQYGFAGRGCTGANLGSQACADTQAARLSSHYGTPIAPYSVFAMPGGNVATGLFETGMATTLSGQVSGGTPISTFFGSLRAYLEDGPFTSRNYDWVDANGLTKGVFSKDINNKYQGTMAIGVTPTKEFKLQFNSLFAVTRNEIPENNNSIYSPYTVALFSKPENAQCDASKSGATDPTYGSAGNGLCKGPGNPTGASSFGSQRELVQQIIKQDARHYNGSVRASYIPSATLNFDATVGIDFTAQRSATFLPYGNNVDLRINRANNGLASVDDRTNQVLTLSVNGGWTANPMGLSSNLIFGGQGYITRTNDESGTNQGFPGPGIEVVGGGSSPRVFESFQSVVNTGAFAQEQLGWHDWVFGTAGGRYDYNSAFGKTEGGVFYPQASFSLVFSDRAGYRDSFLGRRFSTLRLRGAFGKAGRQPGAFDKLTTYGPLTATTGGGLVPDNLGNPNLKPEISTEIEGGLEVGLWDDNVSVDITRWQRTLQDALVARRFPVTGGFRALQLDNIGEMKSWGYDVKVKAYLVNRANLSADVYASTAFLSQLVTSMGGASELKVGGSYPRYRNFIKEGWAPGTFFGARIPLACEAGQTKHPLGGLCLQPGQVPFTVPGSGTAAGQPSTEAQLLAWLAQPRTLGQLAPLQSDDDKDRDVLDHWDGKPLPDFEGSFGGSLTWRRNWRFATNFEYRTGNYTISNLTSAFRTGSPTNGGNTERRATVEMTVQSPSSTAQQRVDAAREYWYSLNALSPYDGMNQQQPGDFVRWRELSATYTAPASWAGRLGASDMSLTLAARNFMLWTKYPGVDPEVNLLGRGSGGGTDQNVGESIDAFGYPIPRQISFNIRLGF